MTPLNSLPDASNQHFAILILLHDDTAADKAASTIDAALRPECVDRVSSLRPSVRGAEFLRQRQAGALDDWWSAHVPEPARLVYLIDDEPGLPGLMAANPGLFFVATPSATTLSLRLSPAGEFAVVTTCPEALVATFLSQHTENDDGLGPRLFRRDAVDHLLEHGSTCADEQQSAAPNEPKAERQDDQDDQDADTAPSEAPRPDPAAPMEEWRSSRVSELDALGASNFTHAVMRGSVPEALGYEPLVRTVTAHLEARRSVLLVGPSQIGKTAIIAAVAQALYANRTGESGRSRIVASLTSSDLLADGNKLGEWEKNLGQVASVARDTGCILYFEDFWFLHEAGRSRDYSSNFSAYLRPLVERGEIVLLGESTFENLTSRTTQKHPLMDDRSFMRHVEVVTVPEPSVEQTRAIVAALARRIERAHPLRIEETALARSVELPRRFLAQQAFPGKAIRLLQAAVHQAVGPHPAPPALDQGAGSRAASAPAEATGAAAVGVPVLTAEAVTARFAEMTGLPLWLLSDAVPLTLESLRDRFEARIIGQPEAVEAVVDAITMVKAELHDPRRPLAVLLFVGPSGVGKTELATILAEELFGQRERLLRFDMSEYQGPFSAATLVEQLTERTRNQVFSVVLLDEFEKAAPSIADLFLQVFDAGRLTDASGSTVDLRNTILILTSNLGSQEASTAGAGASLGFARAAAEDVGATRARQRAAYLDAVKAAFRPEFLNRLDQSVVFGALDRASMRRIVRRELAMALEREGAVRRGLAPQWDASVVDFLVTRGFTPSYGARPLQRAIKQYVLLPLAREIAARPHLGAIPLTLQVRDGQIVVAAEPATSSMQPATAVATESDALAPAHHTNGALGLAS